MNITEYLTEATDQGASDVFIVVGRPLSIKVNGILREMTDSPLMPADTEQLIKEIYDMDEGRDMDRLIKSGDDDFSFAVRGVSRFRASVYKQRGTLAAVVRVITFQIPEPAELGITPEVLGLADYTKGLVLVTGPAGSGKSTTLACIIDQINSTRENHIITLEDPLEFLHSHKKSIVSQREINSDTESYIAALRAALRQSPDAILLGEMRDYETIQVAMTAAETGHLILSTLHTVGAANTIDRIIDVFPPNQQHQIAVQLSMVLRAVVSQQLVPAVDGRRIPVFERMTVTPAIRNMIRENKIHQIDGVVYSSNTGEMASMDNGLQKLYKSGRITAAAALQYASNPEMLAKKL
ncbi:type IV pilus twitching motility protein PilT [Qiania dongpingensis]|uniref:PilT/PilU family type 4a pilus ATPase n=1 Tax=Qiania dongpingensis TaxID=2763669 RepID=A0A7G9G606_9FIRM|nr:PilT/PilU family type 4a pilus ATPase [Qiania dongpingensis]QNM06238.1 PilT/PilU family type 4a pilus ATPase [Qiania dongpingensis]